MDNIYKNNEKRNKQNKKRKMLIVLDYMIADMLHDKKTQSNSNWLIY